MSADPLTILSIRLSDQNLCFAISCSCAHTVFNCKLTGSKKPISIHRAPALLFYRHLQHRPGNAHHFKTKTHAGFSTKGDGKYPRKEGLRMGVQEQNFEIHWFGNLGTGNNCVLFAATETSRVRPAACQSHHEYQRTACPCTGVA